MVSERLPQKMSVDEYLAHEQETGIKHEYIDGDVYMWMGSTSNRSIMIVNCSAELREQLRDKPYRGFGSGVKVKISDSVYIYPAFSVIPPDVQFADEEHSLLLNPILVGDVTSLSEDYDTGTKAKYYRSLPSLQIYLVLDQEKPYAQLWTRNDIGWQLQEFEGLDTVIPLKVIGCQLKMSEVYLDVF